MVGTRPNTGSGEVYDSFLDLWEDCYDEDDTVYAGCGDRTPNTYATFAYDAVYTFARALQAMIDDGEDVEDGDLLLAQLQATDFTGATGPVSFNEDGDRLGVYDVINLQGDTFEVVGAWDKTNGAVFSGTIYWDGSSDTEVPDDGSGEDDGIPGFQMYLALFAMILAVPVVRRFRK
jgi:hypothetical protein